MQTCEQPSVFISFEKFPLCNEHIKFQGKAKNHSVSTKRRSEHKYMRNQSEEVITFAIST